MRKTICETVPFPTKVGIGIGSGLDFVAGTEVRVGFNSGVDVTGLDASIQAGPNHAISMIEAKPSRARRIARSGLCSLTATAAGVALHQQIRAELIAQEQQLIAHLSPEVRQASIEVLRALTRQVKQRCELPASACVGTGC